MFGEKSDWFALYALDSHIDDKTMCNGIIRGEFRLHPMVGQGISKGCITIPSQADFDFQMIRNELLNHGASSVAGTDIKAYGIVTVS